MNQLETFKIRMRPDLFMLECVKKLEESEPIRVRVIRLSGSAWNDLRGSMPFHKQCVEFDNVFMLDGIYVAKAMEEMELGPEFVDCDGNVFLDPDYSKG